MISIRRRPHTSLINYQTHYFAWTEHCSEQSSSESVKNVSKLVTIIFSAPSYCILRHTSYNCEYYYERLLLLVSWSIFWDIQRKRKKAETKKWVWTRAVKDKKKGVLHWIQDSEGSGTRGRPFQMHRERRKKRGWKRHTHTLRHIETRDRLKIAAKIDGKRIMLKASGQWRHAYRNQRNSLRDRERNEKKETKQKKNNIHFCANEWTV